MDGSLGVIGKMHGDGMDLEAFLVVSFDGRQLRIEGPMQLAEAERLESQLGIEAASLPINVSVDLAELKGTLGKVYESRSERMKQQLEKMIRESN